MRNIPFIPKLQKDEFLFSYLLRMYYANSVPPFSYNGFSEFITTFVVTKYDSTAPVGTKYDIFSDLHLISEEESSLDLFLNTTLLYSFTPLWTESFLSNYIGNISIPKQLSTLISPTKKNTTSLKICPECMKEEQENLGFFYYHRAHQIQGVSVCYKHNCALLELDDRTDNALSPTAVFKPIESKDKFDSFKYANFCKDFLDTQLDIDLFVTVKTIKRVIKDKKIKSNDCDTFGPAIKSLLSRLSANNTYCKHSTYLTLLMYLFEDINTLKSEIEVTKKIYNIVSRKDEFLKMIDGKFELLSYKNSIVDLKCKKCGHKFFSSFYRISSGWGCPNCDKEIDHHNLLERIFDIESDGQYELLHINEPDLIVKHLPCGKTSKTTLREFFVEKKKCDCLNIISFAEAQKRVSSSGDFIILEYERTEEPMLVKHNTCGNTFTTTLHKFTSCPFCRKISQPYDMNILSEKLKSLVGDEYEIVGDYDKENHKVTLRHKKCGHIQAFYTKHFMAGQRCEKCSPFLLLENFKKTVKTISCGKYEVLKKTTANLYEIKNTETEEIILLTSKRILQELYRPTPSDILPLNKKNLVELKPSALCDIVYEHILNNYSRSDLITLRTLEIDGLDYQSKKDGLKQLVDKKKIKRLVPGVYCYSDADPEQLPDVRKYQTRKYI